MVKSKRLRINVVRSESMAKTRDRTKDTKRAMQSDNITCISSDNRGTVLRTLAGDDIVISETIDDMVRSSGGFLVKLTPLGFDNMSGKRDHSSRGEHIAVNPDMLAFKAWSEGGSVIYVDGVDRGILVKETPRRISALIDAF